MKDKEIQAINKLNNLLPYLNGDFGQEIKNNFDIVLNGINELDQEVKQKTFEVKNREQLLVQRDNLLVQKDSVINQKTVEIQSKDQKLGKFIKTGFTDSLNKLYPDSYPAKVEKWPDTLPMKKHVVNNDIQVMEKNIEIYKKQIEEKEQENIKKEFISSLHKLYPNAYSADSREWTNKLPMKKHLDDNNFEVMVKNTLYYKSEIKKNKIKELEEAKKLKEENLEKDHLLAQKDQLLLSKESENQKLLIQKEEEVHNKSLAKNQVIGELQEDIGLKEKEALNLKIELLMKQLEFHKKESELKDKALENALEIGKQKDIVNELQGKLLVFKNLSQHDETLQLELSVIHFKVEESILNGNLEEMKEFSKYLSQLIKDPIEKDESLEISELLNNLSPIVHGEENQVQNPLAVINNFDINHINTTHSVLISMSGEESAFSIIQEESLN